MQKQNIITISVDEPVFPEAFHMLHQPVKQLYASGDIGLLRRRPRLGIVGSRKATAYGREVTTHMAKAAAAAGAIIVSGLAIGIDSIAHQGALDVGGSTIAVLPGSIGMIYPACHESLARQIVTRNGLLISEFEKDKPPMKHHFIQRNRLIAALSEVLLITEATLESGSRHTVDFMDDNCKIVAIPGDINRYSSSKPNELIRDGRQPILSPSDLLAILGLNENLMKPKYKPQNEYEAAIINLLSQESLTFNELLGRSKLETSTFNIHMTMLEIKEAIESVGNRWHVK